MFLVAVILCVTSTWGVPTASQGFLFAFTGALELIPFGASSDLRWNFPAGTLELIPFCARSDRLWDLRLPEIPLWGFLLLFPRRSLLWLFVHGELHFPPFGVFYCFPFLGNSINHEMKNYLRSPQPSLRLRTYVIIKYYTPC